MPAVNPTQNQRILVTGANGYIAMWLISALLEQGYTVRGTVRSVEKGKHLRDYFSSYGAKVEWIVVEDITKDSAFDEAVKDVDAIEHTASPLTSGGDDPADFINPAVEGTLGVLKSALQFGNKVKRIVITSSCAAVLNSTLPSATYDENDWGDENVKIIEREGKNAKNMHKYRASKTLAERAAWDFYEKNKGSIKWDLVILNPSLVIGPTLLDVKSPSDLNISMARWWGMITSDLPEHPNFGISYPYVDVRDVAEAHVLALRKEEAKDQRFITSAGSLTWQETRDKIYDNTPQLFTAGVLKRGDPTLERTYPIMYKNEKSKNILGLKYRSAEQVIGDTVADLEARGWFDKPIKT